MQSVNKEVSSLREELYFAKIEIIDRMKHEGMTTKELKKTDEEKRRLATDVQDLQVCVCVCVCVCVPAYLRTCVRACVCAYV